MTKDLRRTFALMQKQGILYCAICGLLIDKKDKVTLDHHIPKSKGGTTDSSNLLPAHKICNQIKADISPENFESIKYQRYVYALEHYNLSRKERYTIKKALQFFEKSK